MRDPLKKLDESNRELWTKEEIEISINNGRYTPVFCLVCGQDYITRIKPNLMDEPLSPRCPRCDSFSYGVKNYRKSEDEEEYEMCGSKIISEEELEKRFMIQRDYTHFFVKEQNL